MVLGLVVCEHARHQRHSQCKPLKTLATGANQFQVFQVCLVDITGGLLFIADALVVAEGDDKYAGFACVG